MLIVVRLQRYSGNLHSLLNIQQYQQDLTYGPWYLYEETDTNKIYADLNGTCSIMEILFDLIASPI